MLLYSCPQLASLVLHLTPDHWPDAVQSLITLFQQDNPNLDVSISLAPLTDTPIVMQGYI